MRRAAIILLLLASVVLLAWSARAAILARSRLDATHAHLAAIEGKAAEVTRLRSLPVAAALEKRPEPGIVGHLTTSLAVAGLPSSLMTSFNPGSDAPYVMPSDSSSPAAPTGIYRKQEARLTLEPLTLPELGRFLKSWKELHPEWTCAAIEVTPTVPSTPTTALTPTTTTTGPAESAPRLRASIGIQAVYLAQGGS